MTTLQLDAVSAHQRHICVSDTPALKTAPNSVVNSVQFRAVRWPEVGQDEFWCDLAKIFDSGTCMVPVMAMATAG